jgi:ATPase
MEIKFEKLFDRFDYDIKLKDDGLTILTGPNGYGKSTILNSIEAISEATRKLSYFFIIDFKKIIIENGDRKIKIEKIIEKNKIKLKIDNDLEIEQEVIDEINYKNQIKGEEFFHGFGRFRNNSKNFLKKEKTIRNKLKEISEKIGKVNYIKEQRLIQGIQKIRNRPIFMEELEEELKKTNIIENLPDEFKKLIDKTLREYSNISNELDSTYPMRLFKDDSELEKKEYEKRILSISEKFEKLKKYDLALKNVEVDKIKFNSKYSNALKIYFDDFDTKYEKYRKLVEQLDLYTGIINQRLSFKKIKISITEGIKIIDDNEKEIELSQLSSGEKHEIIVFYNLIFKTEDNTLLLIDEPEISLHISWQKKFTEDLLRIIQYKKLNVIVATHSPEIIGGFWENQIDLGELYAIRK